MNAQREAILDAIVMVVTADGDVTDREMELAMQAARALPGLGATGAEAELQAALGMAFERFVDEGTAARTGAMAAAAATEEARVEVLLAAAVAACVDGPPSEGEVTCIQALGQAMGVSDEQTAEILAAAVASRP